jgi:hypothetical protein
MQCTVAARARGPQWVAIHSAGALVWLTSGCLVTEHPEYREDNVPAHLVPVGPKDFIAVPSRPDIACDTSMSLEDTTPWMAFTVEVSDPNFEDILEARLVINGQVIDGASRPIARTGEAKRRPLVMCAKLKELSALCNRVEILVSSGFYFRGVYETDVDGDLAVWRWWVLGQTKDFMDARPSDCELQLGDGGLP